MVAPGHSSIRMQMRRATTARGLHTPQRRALVDDFTATAGSRGGAKRLRKARGARRRGERLFAARTSVGEELAANALRGRLLSLPSGGERGAAAALPTALDIGLRIAGRHKPAPVLMHTRIGAGCMGGGPLEGMPTPPSPAFLTARWPGVARHKSMRAAQSRASNI